MIKMSKKEHLQDKINNSKPVKYIYSYDNKAKCLICGGDMFLYMHSYYMRKKFVCESCKVVFPIEEVGKIYKITGSG